MCGRSALHYSKGYLPGAHECAVERRRRTQQRLRKTPVSDCRSMIDDPGRKRKKKKPHDRIVVSTTCWDGCHDFHLFSSKSTLVFRSTMTCFPFVRYHFSSYLIFLIFYLIFIRPIRTRLKLGLFSDFSI